MTPSLRNRLLAYVCVPLLLGLLAIGLGSYRSARLEAGKIYDAQLVHFAQVLHELTEHELREAGPTAIAARIRIPMAASSTPYEKDLLYRVWRGEQLLLQSPQAQLLDHKTHTPGFTDRSMNGRRLRMFMQARDGIMVEVAEYDAARTDLIHHMALSILVPFFFVIPLLVVAVWWGVRIGLRPLNLLSSAVEKLNPAALQPLALPSALPRELAPFAASINQLMARVEEVIEREKRFTGYAAHELRTPLAALKTQMQVALREKDEQQRRQMYGEAVAGVDRMAHLVSQLLLLLRSQKGEEPLSEQDLSALVERVATEMRPAMNAKGQSLACEIAPGIRQLGHADMLRVLLRNLLDNASRYSPQGAALRLHLSAHGQDAWVLRVHNSGVSLSDEECHHMFEPFYRGKQNVTPGAGIGLAIVSWIARMHRLRVVAATEEGGVAVRVTPAE
jgi:two-component system sensor histidine kinase QseC